MITRTQHGYGLGDWECTPVILPSGRKITPTESRALVCRLNGLSQKEAAEEMNCSKSNIAQAWESIYFKTATSDVVVAINKLFELGAIHRVRIILIMLVCSWLTFPAMQADPEADQHTELARRYRSRSSHRSRASTSTRNAQLDHAAELLGEAVYEFCTIADFGGNDHAA
ncbi:helix-turn-helix transcriptional regulator [Neptunomonas concharum]|uniref:Helix-turn-helix transcriptional regulator n=1 Tax=Neptunomonas concharum TaxID=1031538 RepID=A0A5P1RAE4_9GAMM|nr:helix-turn-helix transcriptional regulator [Neptunomonas concharum]QEQ96256.1 helix-turn-helix transcriptional regulator [Neptunomonas concharum]